VLEFHEDLKKIRYIKRLFRKYKETGELKDRLIINHLIVLYNMFEPRAMTRMLIFKLKEYLDCLKPFLMWLNYWTTDVSLIDGQQINDTSIPLDKGIVSIIRQTENVN
jgi:hypothetical protein